jgi:hypothetical protein
MRIGSRNALGTHLRQTGDDRRLTHVKRDTLPRIFEPGLLDPMDLPVILMIRHQVYQTEKLQRGGWRDRPGLAHTIDDKGLVPLLLGIHIHDQAGLAILDSA